VRRALEFYEQSLTIARELGDRRSQGAALFNMSVAHEKLGERGRAIGLAEEALEIFERMESPYAEGVQAQLDEWRG
jgi:tetratricopeptide (TPR) repeat protein